MAFTGVAVVTKVADALARITGISLAPGAAGTIGLFGSGADVELPEGCDWMPYDGIDLAEAVEVSILPTVPVTVAKAAAPFLITLTNDQAAAVAAQGVYGKMSTDVNQPVADLANNALVLFDTQEFESSATVVDVANDRFVAPVAGIYLVTAEFTWVLEAALPVDSTFIIAIQVQGLVSATAQQTIYVPAGGSTPGTNQIASTLQLAAGDAVTIRVSQVSQAQRELAFAEATISLVPGGATAPAATPGLEIYCRFH